MMSDGFPETPLSTCHRQCREPVQSDETHTLTTLHEYTLFKRHSQKLGNYSLMQALRRLQNSSTFSAFDSKQFCSLFLSYVSDGFFFSITSDARTASLKGALSFASEKNFSIAAKGALFGLPQVRLCRTWTSDRFGRLSLFYPPRRMRGMLTQG